MVKLNFLIIKEIYLLNISRCVGEIRHKKAKSTCVENIGVGIIFPRISWAA